MSWLSRLTNVFRRGRLDRELDEELAAHLEEAAEHGRSVDEVRRSFGSALHHRERSRDFKLLPWLEAMHAEYSARGLKIISVHTPELKQEHAPANVRKAVKDLGITYPVMIDGDYSYWGALDNRYWPAFYLVDRKGRIVQTAIGELHRGERRGDAMESSIREQLER